MGTEKKAEKGREQTRPPRAGSCSPRRAVSSNPKLAVLFWSFVCASPASCCRTLPPQAVAIDTGLLLYSAPSFSWAPNVALFLAIVLNMVSARCRSCKLDLRLVQNSELGPEGGTTCFSPSGPYRLFVLFWKQLLLSTPPLPSPSMPPTRKQCGSLVLNWSLSA